MQLISPIDSIFLSAESREHPMHVAGLQLFKPPPGAGSEFVRETCRTCSVCSVISTPRSRIWSKQPACELHTGLSRSPRRWPLPRAERGWATAEPALARAGQHALFGVAQFAGEM
jgi:Wax ester synthase-like Acyl-CoA acyltransferase domain